ncbi:uncharacterized protein LOC117106222 [Anneissia japonica]|uniref:uncharacterized protein LOC117106222 n=1 Tax=Anneissia japonica TaxID=1529436 RepID=UPI0014255A0B|nr:uncharacterized protein LOC117106222 [Anneissia japonica]
MNILVFYIILSAITSKAYGDENKLWGIEGNRIKLSAPTGLLKVTSVESLNWFYGNGTNANNAIVTLVNPNKDPFCIDVTEQSYGDLIIEHVNRTYSGYYTCQVVEKVVFTSWVSTYYLVVYYMDPPTISTNWSTENSHATFFCFWSRTNPDKPIVKWFLDGRELKSTKNKLMLCEEKRKATLVILKISAKGLGNYTCSITVNTNKGVMSKISKGLVLHVTGLPVKVSTYTVLIVTAVTSFILGSFPTCLICHCVRKRHERESHHQCQRHQNQVLQLRSLLTRATHQSDDGAAARNAPNVENVHPL